MPNWTRKDGMEYRNIYSFRWWRGWVECYSDSKRRRYKSIQSHDINYK